MTSRESCTEIIIKLIEQGYTLESISDKIGFSLGSVYYWKHGRLAPSIVVDKLRRMVK